MPAFSLKKDIAEERDIVIPVDLLATFWTLRPWPDNASPKRKAIDADVQKTPDARAEKPDDQICEPEGIRQHKFYVMPEDLIGHLVRFLRFQLSRE